MGAAIAIASATYVTLAALTWYRFGRKRSMGGKGQDSRLEPFLPEYEVREYHCVAVSAPAKATYAAAIGMDLKQSKLVRALFRIRELPFGSVSNGEEVPRLGLLEQAKLWGWGVLSEDRGREIIFGAVTQPWRVRPVFRALSPAEFAAFKEPGYAKIAWTLRADPLGSAKSMACTETRVVTTDPVSRAHFRRYWALSMPGIVLIRLAALRLVKKEAEATRMEMTETTEAGIPKEH